ncbi:TRAP transporter small permease [Falsihalocynthiibacter arcticus]|uniref:TRAP transporter small permease protein n=1 Tax=Falsihalocynthiibacter arcticus TaxID=1579316 RepID=A0A126UWS7_9RHOB|nr:TRAP transporter small permease [Falsihalocynthiibacter arcticus]AML50494.1 C4-dicarboxylate ABC transporter permease [Falsihalocynthiibacter arcticus]
MDYRPKYPTGLRLLSKSIDGVLFLGGTAIVSLVFVNAFLRGAAGFDLAWSLEITAFLLLWTTFLGCAAAIARGAHMRVTEIVDNLFSLVMRRRLVLFIDLVVAALLISLIYTGFSISSHTWAQKTTVLYWPVGLLYASMPVGMACTLLFHAFNIAIDLRTPPTDADLSSNTEAQI